MDEKRGERCPAYYLCSIRRLAPSDARNHSREGFCQYREEQKQRIYRTTNSVRRD